MRDQRFKVLFVKKYGDGDFVISSFTIITELLRMSESVCVEYPNGVREWRKPDRTLHREDGPAIDFRRGKEWYLNGLMHRKGGPAAEYSNGSKYWYSMGKVHRVDGPAVEYANGDKLWYVNDMHHRTDGPAECSDKQGSKWCLMGARTCKKEVSNRLFSTNLKNILISRVVNHHCPIAMSGYGW